MLPRRTARVLAAVLTSAALVAAPLRSDALGTGSAVTLTAQGKTIPAPKDYFGFAMGTTGRLAGFDRIKQYFRLVADRSDRVEYSIADTTTLGNEYPVIFVSAPENLRDLDRIVRDNRRLADPGVSEQEARRLSERSKPVYLIEGTLHSTEVGNTQALVDIVHRFATEKSDYTDTVLKNAVLMVIPSGNPDGQHLVVDHFNKTAGTAYNRVYPDLYHKYVGHDNNRDWFMFSQRETRTRVRLEQTYRPVAGHYMHQAGTGGPRLWTPPYDEPLGNGVDPITIQSANTQGQVAARALTAENKKGVGSDDAYGIFWNADVMGYSTFLGTSLFLTEIASARDLAYPFTSADGKPLGPRNKTIRMLQPYDQNTWTLEQIVAYAKTAAYAGIENVAKNPESWLYNNLYQVTRNNAALPDVEPGTPEAYVVPAGQRDPFAVYELMKLLEFGRVEIDQARTAFTAGGKNHPAGSYVLRTRQPLGRWIHQLLQKDVYPEQAARKCADCPLIMPYSETTDNAALLLGVDAVPVEKAFSAPLQRVQRVVPQPARMPAAPRGAYLVAPESYGVAHVLSRLQKANVPVFRAGEEFEAAGRTFAPGTVVVPPTPAARQTLQDVSAATGLPVHGADAMPKVDGFTLKPGTRVGLIRGANNMPGGWMTWMLDQYGIDYKVVGADDYADLDGRYDTVVLADGVSKDTIVKGLDPAKNPPQFAWARGVGEEGWKALGDFVKGGGNLVAVGSGSETARQLLDLPVENATPTDTAKFNVPGALLRASYKPDVPAAWGMPKEWPVWFNRDAAYRVTGDAEVASAYPEGDLLASGYGRGTEALGGLANVVSFEVGEGSATLAGSEITFRSWPRATWPIVVNSIYQGPSEPSRRG
ncbi:M14 family zinc carboxypeptidase [Actinomadura rugatobispora]|uniref:M14 family zinc carboxypeptidase n=1 Tax=Actinomadura rugatobispora TaxID=1994 RepID=A0ABW1A6K5_9ACTN|nr:M14 family metallopeptidase [Actinomadura rugatobispora]